MAVHAQVEMMPAHAVARPANRSAWREGEEAELGMETQLTLDPEERADALLRDLRSSRAGLSEREVERRLAQYGRNEIRRREGPGRLRELARQFTHPLTSRQQEVTRVAICLGAVKLLPASGAGWRRPTRRRAVTA
jgi:magnesium-transporting ATPase (P-type)